MTGDFQRRPRNLRRLRGTAKAFRETDDARWISVQQMITDVQQLVAIAPADLTAIVGIARSGMTAASMLAMQLHLPLYAVRQTLNDIVAVGNGWRLGGAAHIETEGGKVMVVDDTVMSGNSLRAVEKLICSNFPEHLTAAVYVNPMAAKKPDVWVHELGWPHLLEWNLFNSVLSPNMACDLDGILCHDCLPQDDDDGPRYLDFIRTARPKYLPRRVPVPLIVTARIEKYRGETTDWLARHGVKFWRLVMHPGRTLTERRRDDIVAFKAEHFERWARRHRPRPAPLAFIESDDRQARGISLLTGRMAICPSAGTVYASGNEAHVYCV